VVVETDSGVYMPTCDGKGEMRVRFGGSTQMLATCL